MLNACQWTLLTFETLTHGGGRVSLVARFDHGLHPRHDRGIRIGGRWSVIGGCIQKEKEMKVLELPLGSLIGTHSYEHNPKPTVLTGTPTVVAMSLHMSVLPTPLVPVT